MTRYFLTKHGHDTRTFSSKLEALTHSRPHSDQAPSAPARAPAAPTTACLSATLPWVRTAPTRAAPRRSVPASGVGVQLRTTDARQPLRGAHTSVPRGRAATRHPLIGGRPTPGKWRPHTVPELPGRARPGAGKRSGARWGLIWGGPGNVAAPGGS